MAVRGTPRLDPTAPITSLPSARVFTYTSACGTSLNAY